MAAASELRVHLQRRLPAPPQQVWNMHAQPDQLQRWWGPTGFTARGVELDLRVGGQYRITMQPPTGDAFLILGEFREIEPPVRLAYTFRYEEPDPDDRETLVTVSLEPADGLTLITVDQGEFATRARLELHEQGWSQILGRLYDVLANDAGPGK